MFGTNEIVGKKTFSNMPKDNLMITSMFFTLQGEGPYSGQPAVFIRLAKCNLSCKFCFVPSTKITMADGKTKRIDQIQVGDEVMSWDKDKMVPKKVIKTYTSIADEIVKVSSTGEPVWCTPEHPFLTSNKGWVNAEDLKEGYDTLFRPLTQPELKMSEHSKIREKVASYIYNGKVVKKVEFINKDDGRPWARLFGTKTAERIVYNFEVEDTHTYIANGCVVHNCDTFFDDGDQMTFSEIENNIDKIIKEYWSEKGQTIPEWVYNKVYNPDLDETINKANVVLVLTGGEPLLQENITAFMQKQIGRFKAVQVESNGILNTKVPYGITLVCSPKCSEKDGVAVKYLAPSDTILNRADCLKFVMTADTNSPYHTVPQWAHDWKKRTGKTIYCSPMNVYNDLPQKIKLLRAEKGNITMAIRSTVDEKIDFWEKGVLNLEENEKNHKYTAQYCMDHGFSLNLQVHLYAALP